MLMKLHYHKVSKWIFIVQTKKVFEPITSFVKEYCKQILFNIQVLQALEGAGYNNIRELDIKMRRLRDLKRGFFWIETLKVH